MVQGSGIDAPLNETGMKQAAAFYQAYKDTPFDKIYTTNLIRTKQTVNSFTESGIPTEELADLREISWGSQEGVPFSDASRKEYYDINEQWNQGNYHAKIQNGESPHEVTERLARGFEYITAQPDESKVLICMHGRAMRILMCHLLQIPMSEMDSFEHKNTCLYLINWDGESYTLEKRNEISHLELVMS